MTTANDPCDFTCTKCSATRTTKITPAGRPRLPKGWKVWDGKHYCPECKHSLYRLRAITLPVDGILDGTWDEFRVALREGWSQSTCLANWAINQLIRADVVRTPDMVRLPAFPNKQGWLYQQFQQYVCRDFWAGAATCANSIINSVEACYREHRQECVWRSESAFPSYRYPYPYPVHNQSWSAGAELSTGVDGQAVEVPTVCIPLTGRRWSLRLRSGYNVRRHLAGFRHIANSTAQKGELAIYRRRVSNGCHRATMTERVPGGGNRVQTRVMVKMVAWLPKEASREGMEGTLNVMTGRGAFLTAQQFTETPWVLHNDQVRGWIAQHDMLRQRIADDITASRA